MLAGTMANLISASIAGIFLGLVHHNATTMELQADAISYQSASFRRAGSCHGIQLVRFLKTYGRISVACERQCVNLIGSRIPEQQRIVVHIETIPSEVISRASEILKIQYRLRCAPVR
jgi:hypothetical protein